VLPLRHEIVGTVDADDGFHLRRADVGVGIIPIDIGIFFESPMTATCRASSTGRYASLAITNGLSSKQVPAQSALSCAGILLSWVMSIHKEAEP
jgi:hypothetical protein